MTRVLISTPTSPIRFACPASATKTSLSNQRHLCARAAGFSLHAARMVEAHDREGLERLCRAVLRAPLSSERLSLDSDGNVHLRLLGPWPGPGGKTEISFEPL